MMQPQSERDAEQCAKRAAPPCCCSVRRKETVSEPESWFDYEAIEPYLIAVSGASLIVSFFCHLPVDAAWIAIIISGAPLFYTAGQAILRRQNSVEVLIAIAIFSTILAEFCFPAEHGHHSYLFAGGEVAFIMALGHWLEEWTISRARAGIENLVKLTPKTARKLDGETESIVLTAEVQQNDILRVLPGETIPADGEIVTGNTSIDQSLLTGESLPVDRIEGDSVFGGTTNQFGSFTMRATSIGEDSSLARMIQLVREAEQKKAPMERLADQWAAFLVPAALFTAVVVGVVTYFLTEIDTAAEESFRRAVTILVVFCPCSLVLATPTAIIASIGNASHHGILIRSGEALEQLAAVNVLAFDKTGTLTHGLPKLTSVQSFDIGYDSNGILSLAASVETLSEHPLAACIVDAAAEKNLELLTTTEFEMFRGEGISAKLAEPLAAGSQTILVGNDRLLTRFGVEPTEFQKSQAAERFAFGETVVWVAFAEQPLTEPLAVGFLSLADTIRESSKEAIGEILSRDIAVMLLTGDNHRSAQRIGEMSGITDVKAELLPNGKVEAITALQVAGSHVGMVGDGLNDAPALKTADVGIAMGKIGSDLTIDAADVVLIGDDIARLPFLLRLAKKTKRTIMGNICLSMGINAVAIVLASSGLMGPVIGALVHNAGSFFVVLNASLLLNVRR
jgi:heavy metal translocating P-type ATPase